MYHEIYEHYLGSQSVNQLMRDLEREFLELKYTGDNPRVKYTFLDYTLKHVDLHIERPTLRSMVSM